MRFLKKRKAYARKTQPKNHKYLKICGNIRKRYENVRFFPLLRKGGFGTGKTEETGFDKRAWYNEEKTEEQREMATNTAIEIKEVVKRDEVAREGVSAVYRLIRRGEGFTVSVECNGQSEEVSAFPGGEADARRLYGLAVSEFVLPGTLSDVWRDLHAEG